MEQTITRTDYHSEKNLSINRYVLVALSLILLICGCTTHPRYGAEMIPNLPVVELSEVVQRTRLSGFAVNLKAYTPEQLGLASLADSLMSDSSQVLFLKTDPSETRFDFDHSMLEATLTDGRKLQIPVDAIDYLETDRFSPGNRFVDADRYLEEARKSTIKPISEIKNNNNPYWQRLELRVGNSAYDPNRKELTVLSSKGQKIRMDIADVEYVKIKKTSYVKAARYLIVTVGITLMALDIHSIY